MLKVILADDEPLIIKGLKKLVDWNGLGMEVISEAHNGKNLYELTEHLKPDIVITDIQMPHLSGIEYIKKMREQGLDVKVLFISAYEEFSYARDAIAYGASGYLVKPLRRDQLIKELEKVKKIITEEESQSQQESELAVYKKKSKKDQMIDWFYEILDNHSSHDKKHIAKLKEKFTSAYFTVLSISIDRTANKQQSDDWRETENQLLYFALQNLIEESLNGQATGLILNRQDDEFHVIVNHNETQHVDNVAHKIVKNAEDSIKVKLYIGVGDIVKLEDLRASFESSQKRSKYYYFLAPKSMITEQDFKQPKLKVTSESLTAQKTTLFYSIISDTEEEMKGKLADFFDWLKAISDERNVITKITCFSVISELFAELRQIGILEDHEPGDQELLNKLHKIPTFLELKTYITTTIEHIFNKLEKSNSTKENFQIKVVKDFIEANYNEDITLESIASLIHMNSYYFSSFFKKHTKTNFKKYLTDIRMKEALRLLLNEDLLVYEVAEKVGYNNVRQFSDMFKKYYKKLPSDYR